MDETILEIIRKECEQYRLIELGLFDSVERVAAEFLPGCPIAGEEVFADFVRFQEWRRKVIDHFYRFLDYDRFLNRHMKRPDVNRFLFALCKRVVRRMQEEWSDETIDRVLAVPEHTLAFKLSVLLWQEINRSAFSLQPQCHNPLEIENSLDAYCRGYYPVDLDKLIDRLHQDDGGFWDELYLSIKKIVGRVTSSSMLSSLYRAETEQDTWSEASLLLHEKILSGTTPEFESAMHLRNYIIRICQNKYYEAMRRNPKPGISLDDPDWGSDAWLMKIADDPNPAFPVSDTWILSDIDTDCDYEVSCALTSILWNETEPWYSRLVDGLEDKVAVLLLHYTEGLSYEQIAERQQPEEMSAPDRKRFQAKLRQDTVRVRKTLKERFIQILTKQ